MRDWEKSHPRDLSDMGLLADLKKREGLSPDHLALYEDSEDGPTTGITNGATTARRRTKRRRLTSVTRFSTSACGDP